MDHFNFVFEVGHLLYDVDSSYQSLLLIYSEDIFQI